MTSQPIGVPKGDLGFSDNKSIPIKSILGINITKFRSIESQVVRLGSQVTLLSGRNGTMKTSIMGLIAHPFSSDAKDAFGRPLKTMLNEVFRFSSAYDREDYEYGLVLDVGATTPLEEPVRVYFVAKGTNRHRVVVSGAAKGDGNFSLNTSLLNMKRLFPMVDTDAANGSGGPKLTSQESADLKKFFEYVFPSTGYDQFEPVFDRNIKTTFALTGANAKYDFASISSGEDNLGAVFNRLLGFQRAFQTGQTTSNGILCIDEFESALHPVAQIRLLKYLINWSKKFKVQVLISTHSLYLIQHVYTKLSTLFDDGSVVINFMRKATAAKGNFPIAQNPPYDVAYKELTLESPEQVAAARKVRVLCEDEFAVHFIKRLVKTRKILDAVEFVSSLKHDATQPGTSFSALRQLCIQFPLLIEHALVVFDGDVKATVTNDIGKKVNFLVLPDAEEAALERRIIAWIMGMDNTNDFFVKFGKEQEAFLGDFSERGIPLKVKDVFDEKIVNIKLCKGWSKAQGAAFKKYVTYYADQLPERDAFAASFLAKINEINLSLGVPQLTN